MENNKLSIRLSTISALSDEIDWQSWVSGIGVQKDGVPILVQPVKQEDWQELLYQRARETEAFKESGLSLPAWAHRPLRDNDSQ